MSFSRSRVGSLPLVVMVLVTAVLVLAAAGISTGEVGSGPGAATSAAASTPPPAPDPGPAPGENPGNGPSDGLGDDVGATDPGSDGDRPNIILVTADDMTNSDLAWMPTLRALLTDQGVSYAHSLSPHPLCCPARAAILTGQYAQNNGVKSNQSPFNYEALQKDTALPVWLHRAGYRTGFTGKYLNGFGTNGPRQPGWDYWDPTMIGQYAYTPFQMYNDGNRTWYRDVNNVDYIADRVVDLVDRWSDKDEPFFIWASHVAPHGRLDQANGISSTAVAYPPRRFRHLFADVQSPSLSDAGYLDDDVSDNNSLVQSKKLPTVAKVNQVFRSRIRALQGVDEGLAAMVDALRENGELDNTYLFFTSDNGFLLGEHHLVTKNVPYHQSVEVPLIVRGPGVPAGAILDGRALMIDLAPTFADIAGATPLVTVDGVSLLPSLEQDAPLRETVLIQAGIAKQADDGGTGWWWRGVTTPRYTYAQFYADQLEELYDRRLDPSENVNLSDDPRYAGVLAEMRSRTAALVDCVGPGECSADFGGDPLPSS